MVEVHDLGWVPRIARGWKVDPPTDGLVRIAGPFLTAVGGYPADRTWAPSGSVEAGADILVHVPWTEPLPDDLLRAMARSMRWTSTFAIHADADLGRALDNARRFIRLGGRLDYGTDMGNDAYRGPMSVGPRPEEITALGQAGLTGDALLESLTGSPGHHLLAAAAVHSPLPLPSSAAEVAVWVNGAHRLVYALEEGAPPPKDWV